MLVRCADLADLYAVVNIEVRVEVSIEDDRALQRIRESTGADYQSILEKG
jgi:hypothetical protein